MQPITAAQPAAPRDGLAGIVGLGLMIPETDPLDQDGRWATMGFQLEGIACFEGYTTTAGCNDSGSSGRVGRKRYLVGPVQRPFAVGAEIECSTFGGRVDVGVWNAEARAELERVQWPKIAAELWTGETSTQHQYLASPEATIIGGGAEGEAVSVVEAVSQLERALAGCQAGGPDLLHFPRRAVPWLANAGLLVDPNPTSGRLYTHNGSLVVADRGYPNIGPASIDDSDPEEPVLVPGEEPANPAHVWAYGTGVITARLGPVQDRAKELNEAVAMQTNDVAVGAERLVGIGWLCCHFAILVDLSAETDDAGAGGEGEGLVMG